MTADLAASCADLKAWLPVALELITEPDTDGTSGGGQPGTRPPWNQSAANAAMDAHEGVRRLEASLRLAVTGHTGRRRGGSDAATMAALAAVEALGNAVSDSGRVLAARFLDRWTQPIQELPAVDQSEPWRKIPGYACPYCQIQMVYARLRALQVTCLRHGACRDSDNQHPHGHMEISRLNGNPIIRWQDGLVT